MDNTISKEIIFKYLRISLRERQEGSYWELINILIHKLISDKYLSMTDRIKQFGSQVVLQDNKALSYSLSECYFSILIHGIIMPRPTPPIFGGLDCWGGFVLTEYGKSWIKEEDDPVPEDFDYYISFIKNKIHNIDDILIQYINESLGTFKIGHIFASGVMLGAASEKLIYLLGSAIEKNLSNGNEKRTIVDLINKKRNLTELFDKIISILKRYAACDKIPYSIHEESIDSLSVLFTMVRIQRNEAIHPSAGRISKDQLRLLLLSFPHVCIRTYKIIEYININGL
jgi:hypothetical protein